MWALQKISSLMRSPLQSDKHPDEESPPRNRENQRKQQALDAKLKGYFSLAKGEIDKALHAEEQDFIVEAMKHYRAAQAILIEGISASDTSHFQDSNIVSIHVEKMLKWQDEVNERVQVLSRHMGPKAKGSMSGSQSFCERNVKVKAPMLARRNVVQKLSIPDTTIASGPSSRSPRTGSLVPKGVDSKLASLIENEILDKTPTVTWESIAGLEKAKQTLLEMVILPMKRSDLFTGLRKPARGLLLFGPPGNGKTMLAKAVASESLATFFNISASSLTSKWVGEGEKMMRALFAIAKARQPSVIFIDEMDSLLSSRNANEHEASRRLKSEFLVQFDGVISNGEDRVVVMGATNRPEEIDDAVRRRFVKRIYVPLPDMITRKALLNKLLMGGAYAVPSSDIHRISCDTDGYSCSDLHALCQEAAMFPIRELGMRVNTVKANQIRSLKYSDFQLAMQVVRPSVSRDQLRKFELWNEEFGSN